MLKENQLYKILVVEDNLGDYVLVEEYIRDNFLRVEFFNAKSYKEFVEIINSNKDIDIIFLDLTLPDKNGIELIEACTTLVDTIPIVVLTGYPDFNFALKSLSLGVSDYLLKEDLGPTTIHKCIIYNIERFKNTVKIKESEQSYLDLFQLSPNPLLVYDENTKMILDVNNSAINQYQYNLEEFLKLKIDDLKVENKLELDINENLIAINKSSTSLLDDIECHKKKDDELFFVIKNKNKIIFQGKKAVIVSLEDLTKEIVHIQSIQLQNKKLREIAWIQSHVVRAPLARIMGLINLLSEYPTDEIDQQSIYKMIMETSADLDKAIKEIVVKTKEM